MKVYDVRFKNYDKLINLSIDYSFTSATKFGYVIK